MLAKVVLTLSILALIGVAPAVAAPPTVVTVSAKQRHVQAVWQLTPGAEARVIEVATAPDTSSDGYFFSENVEDSDTLEPGQTTWSGAQRLKPGTYYVHVASHDSSCDTCPSREWSKALVLTIRNVRPTLRTLQWAMRGHGLGSSYYVTVQARVRVCDDVSGYFDVVREERKWLNRRTFARERSSDYLRLRNVGCQIFNLSWRLSDSFFGVGNYTVRLWAKDADGATSSVAQKNWYTRD